jgi:hypothetical protein
MNEVHWLISIIMIQLIFVGYCLAVAIHGRKSLFWLISVFLGIGIIAAFALLNSVLGEIVQYS